MRKLVYWVATALTSAAVLASAACAATPTPTQAPPPAPTATTAPAASATLPPATNALATAVPDTATPAASATTAATAAASPTSSATTTATVHTVAAGEVVKLAGNSFSTSDTYRFGADTTLDVSWSYTGTAPFALWLVNVSDTVTDPNYDRILVDDITGPHSGSLPEKIIAGDWQVQVEQAEGPWTVAFKPES